MTKKQNKILVWILVWAGLLLAVLYSPVGSPDIYSTPDYSVTYQNVSNNYGAIQNATKIKSTQEYNDQDPDIPEVSTTSTSNYTVGSYQSSNSYSQGTSYSVVQPQTYQTDNYSGSVEGGGSYKAGGGNSRSTDASSGFSMTNGVTTLSTTTSLTNSGTKQSVTTYTANTGGTDPGGDPTGNPIPVGDGWGVLALFCVLYVLVKMLIV